MIRYWDPDNGEQVSGVVLYLAENEEYLAIQVQESGPSRNQIKMLCRLPKGRRHLVPDIAAHLHLTKGIEISPFLQKECRPIVDWYTAWQKYAISSLTIKAPPPPPSNNFSHLREFEAALIGYCRLRNDILRKSPYFGIESKEFRSSWWDSPQPMQMKLANWLKVARKLPNKNKDILDLESTLSEKLASLQRYQSYNNEQKHYFMSGVSFGIAKEFIKDGDHDTGLTLLHRSLDFAFQGLAISEGLVTCSSTGLSYNHGAFRDKPVSLSPTSKLLTMCGVVLIPPDLNHDVTRINNIRNNLILTHSSYSALDSDSARFSCSCHTLVSQIIPDKDVWRSGINLIAKTPPPPLTALFYGQGFDDLYFQVTPEEILA